MKRFWLVLLSLGLIPAFGLSAFAADVKFSGEYYAAGLYLNHMNVKDPSGADFARSTAFFYQRLRVGTDFVVSPCLRVVTRFDAMERVWEPDSVGNYAPLSAAGADNGDTRNLDFDIAYIDYTSPIGQFQVGYMPDYMWGTIWGNRTTGPTTGQIKYFLPIGPVTLVAAYAKEKENDYSVQNTGALANDRDYDSYRIGPIYKFKGEKVSGETGFLLIYNLDATQRGSGVLTKSYVLQPYFKSNLGPLTLQGEINYAFGDVEYDLAPDQDISSLTAFLDGDAKFGIFNLGGSLAYVQGDNDSTDNEINNFQTGGRDWDPCWMMFNNSTMNSWVGRVGSYATKIGGEMSNAWFGQFRAGVKPVSNLNLVASVSYAKADQKPAGFVDDEYGWEIDLTGTYKITNNLSYMLGAGYLFTGDYYKGAGSANTLNDNYMIINKLTLAF